MSRAGKRFVYVCISLRGLDEKTWAAVLLASWLACLVLAAVQTNWQDSIDVFSLTAADAEPVYRGDPNKPLMSLSVNVDWGQEVLPDMLDTLAKYGVRAPFFVTGHWAKQYPELVRRMAAEGHEVANHGMRHVHPTRLSDSDLTMLILENHNLLKGIVGEPTQLFAPPYGEVDRRVAAAAAALGYRTIMWTIDTIDWQEPSVETTVARVMNRAQNGGIVLMHPKVNTVKALPRIIEGLRERGFKLLPVGELLQEMEGEEPGSS